jgi:hypothetical protein
MINVMQGRAEIHAQDDCRTGCAGQKPGPAAKEPGEERYWDEKEDGKLEHFAGCEIVAHSDQHQGHRAEKDRNRLMLIAQKLGDIHLPPIVPPRDRDHHSRGEGEGKTLLDAMRVGGTGRLRSVDGMQG